MEKQDKKDKSIFDNVTEQVDKKIKAITEQGIQQTNIEYLGNLIDIKKDISKINHLEMEDENMMYRGYDNYGRDSYGTYGNDYYNGGRRRDSQGRYMENGRSSYGRRYRGHDMIDDMADSYGEYMENRENGRYGSPEMGKALDYMLKSVEEFMMMLKKDASSQEEVEKIKRTARKISDM